MPQTTRTTTDAAPEAPPIITADLGEQTFRAFYEDLWAGKIAFVNVGPLSKHAFSALSRIWYDAKSNELLTTHKPGTEPLCFDVPEYDYRGMLWNTKYKYLWREIGSFQVEILQPDTSPEYDEGGMIIVANLTDDELTRIIDRLLKGEVELRDLITERSSWDRIVLDSGKQELTGYGFMNSFLGDTPGACLFTTDLDVDSNVCWFRCEAESFRVHDLPNSTTEDNLTPEQQILHDLVYSQQPATRTQAARSRHLTLAQQQHLAQQPEFMTRSLLAENPITDLSILRELAQDEHSMVARDAANNIVQRIG